jgi:hypothetical protein
MAYESEGRNSDYKTMEAARNYERQIYWLLGLKSTISTSNKLLIHKSKLKPTPGLGEYSSGIMLPVPR